MTKWPWLERTASRWMPRAAMRLPQRRSSVSSTPMTTGPLGAKAATSNPSSTSAAARADQRARFSTRWQPAKSAIVSRPAARRAALTVRRCMVSRAPSTSTGTRPHVGPVNRPANGASHAASSRADAGEDESTAGRSAADQTSLVMSPSAPLGSTHLPKRRKAELRMRRPRGPSPHAGDPAPTSASFFPPVPPTSRRTSSRTEPCTSRGGAVCSRPMWPAFRSAPPKWASEDAKAKGSVSVAIPTAAQPAASKCAPRDRPLPSAHRRSTPAARDANRRAIGRMRNVSGPGTKVPTARCLKHRREHRAA